MIIAIANSLRQQKVFKLHYENQLTYLYWPMYICFDLDQCQKQISGWQKFWMDKVLVKL